MDFNYSEMQRMLVDSASRLNTDTYTLENVRAQKNIVNGLNENNWMQFADMGWLGLLIPEDAGGLGCPFEDAVILNTILGKGLAVEPYVSTSVIGGDLIAAMPQGEIRSTLLDGIVSGRVRVALAHGEPGERYGDAGARKTSAIPEGNDFVLSGQKMLVLDGAAATHFAISATCPDGTQALFIVATETGGIEGQPYQLIDGSAATDLVIRQSPVAACSLIASGTPAVDLLQRILDRARVALMAQAVGAMEACNEACSTYVKERHQFGQPIGKFQALQHIMADMFVSAHQARSALYYALACIDGDAGTRAAAVSTAKLAIGEASQFVSRSGIQLHGGYGVTDEYMVSHYFRRLVTLEKMYGDLDYHSRRLAAHMFDSTGISGMN